MEKIIIVRLALLLCSHWGLVAGDYMVEVTTRAYSNPTSLAVQLGGYCCDNTGTRTCNGEDQCDTYFAYCLRPINTRGDVRFDCQSTPVQSGVSLNNQGINFNQANVLGLPNPLTLPGFSTAFEGAQIYIEVLDDDVVSDPRPGNLEDLVDSLTFDIPSNTGSGTVTRTQSGTYSSVTGVSLTIDYRIVCAENFYGDRCELQNYCSLNAVNCNSGSCLNTQDSYTCQCDDGFTGDYCELVDYCQGQSCSSRGVCVNGPSTYTCDCNDGYTGTNCESWDYCYNQNCFSRGVCQNGPSDYTCVCEQGNSGKDCDINIESCQEALGGDGALNTGAMVVGLIGGTAVLVLTVVTVVLIVCLVRRAYTSKHNVNNNNAEPVGKMSPIQTNQNKVYRVPVGDEKAIHTNQNDSYESTQPEGYPPPQYDYATVKHTKM